MNEGSLGGTYHIPIINPAACVQCGNPITREVAYALGAPYNCIIHTKCMPYFPYDGRYPHALPVALYNQPLRTSQDDSVVAYSKRQ